MTIIPFMNERARSSSAPFDSRLPVVSRPTWRVYDVRSNSWSAPPNTISTCSTELRSPSSRLSTRLRTRREPSCASAQWRVAPSPIDGVAVLERDGRGGQLLEAGDLEPRVAAERRTSSVPARNDWPPSRRRRPDGDELLEHGRGRRPRRGAMSVRDDAARGRRAGGPADDDRAREAHAGRDVEHDALAPQRAGQLREPVVGGQARRRPRAARGRVPDRRPSRSAIVVELDAGGGRLGRQDRGR